MSGVLRLGNTGAGTGRSTLVAAASNDQTFSLPEAGGTLLTSNYSVPGGTITFDGSDINITNGDLNVDSGTLFVDESTNRVGIGTASPATKLHIEGIDGVTLRIDAPNNYSSIADILLNRERARIRTQIDASGGDPGGSLILSTRNTTAAFIDALTIDNTGNITIGRDGSSLFFQNGFNNATSRINNSGSSNNATLNFYTTQSAPLPQLSINPTGLIAQGGRDPVAQGSPQLLLWGDDCTQNITSTGATNFTSFAGLKFTVAGASTGDYSKAGIFAQRQSSYTDLDMLFAFRSTADSAGVTPADEKIRITSDGILLIGLSTARTNFYGSLSSNLQIQGSGFAACSVYATNGNGAYILGRSNATNGSSIGNISWQINDGSTMVPGASINCIVDGVPGAGDCPTRLEFSTRADGAASQTQRMYMWSDGDITVGTASRNWFSQTQQFAVRAINATGCAILALQDTGGEYPYEAWNASNAAGTRGLIKFRCSGSGSVVGAITTDGSTTTYGPTSDYRAKENIIPLTNAIQRFKKLKPYNYNFITTPDIPRDGFLAHEVEDIIPDAVVGKKDAVDEKGEPIYQGLDLTRIIPLLSAALQETLTKVETLEAEVSKLRSK